MPRKKKDNKKRVEKRRQQREICQGFKSLGKTRLSRTLLYSLIVEPGETQIKS